MEYCSRNQCMYCNSPLLDCHGKGFDHIAQIWSGALWDEVKHGTKMCSNTTKCKARYKLNYVALLGEKPNHLTSDVLEDDSTIILVHPGLGFRLSYLRQLWHRSCRCSVSCQGETATILLTHPSYKPTYASKGVRQKDSMTMRNRI